MDAVRERRLLGGGARARQLDVVCHGARHRYLLNLAGARPGPRRFSPEKAPSTAACFPGSATTRRRQAPRASRMKSSTTRRRARPKRSAAASFRVADRRTAARLTGFVDPVRVDAPVDIREEKAQGDMRFDRRCRKDRDQRRDALPCIPVRACSTTSVDPRRGDSPPGSWPSERNPECAKITGDDPEDALDQREPRSPDPPRSIRRGTGGRALLPEGASGRA
jgi:hypothetical protein